MNSSVTWSQESNEERRNAGIIEYSISLSVKAYILIKLNFVLYVAGKFTQRYELIVTGREEMVKNL